jgi:ATP-binding cassette subfamily F protein 3
MLVRPANLILMDEPTNHLDIPSREILTDALNAYKGTLCFITHDRTLIREIANKIIQVREGRVTVFPSSYDDYLWQDRSPDGPVEMMGNQSAAGQSPRRPTAASKRQRKALEGRLRNEYYRAISPARERIKEIEQEIAANAARIEEIESMIADPSHYQDSRKVVAVNHEYAALRERAARLTAERESLLAEAERIDRDYSRKREELPG